MGKSCMSTIFIQTQLERSGQAAMTHLYPRKGMIRRRLGMRKYDSIGGRFGDRFQEAVARVKKLMLKFLQS